MRQAFEDNVEEERRNIEREFWARHQDKCEVGSQYKPLLDGVVGRVRLLAQEQHLDAWDHERKLDEAEEVVQGIAEALKWNWKDAPNHRFWYGFDDSQLIERPDSWSDASPISTGQLDAAAARYLEQPWLQNNRLDWYILNGFVSDGLLRLADEIKSGTATGQLNWAYLLSGGNYFRMLCWRVGLEVAKFAALWFLLPALAGLAYYLGYMNVVMWILGLFTILIAIRVISFPSRFTRRRAQKRQATELEDMVRRLIRIQHSCNAMTLNPTLLRDRVAEAERGEPLVRPAVYSILDRAISRDPAVFTFNG